MPDFGEQNKNTEFWPPLNGPGLNIPYILRNKGFLENTKRFFAQHIYINIELLNVF
jgi:hypothetical protein